MSPASARRWPRSISASCRATSLVIVAIVAAALFGAAFAAIPGYLQAKRDSHIVITTIMFNYIASALMGYLLVNVLREPGQMNAGDARAFRRAASCRRSMSCSRQFGVHWPVTPLNLSFLLALARRARRLGADLAHAARL